MLDLYNFNQVFILPKCVEFTILILKMSILKCAYLGNICHILLVNKMQNKKS